MPTFTSETELPVSRHEAFRWHTRDGAFDRLMPPWQDVDAVTMSGDFENRVVDLRLRRGPIKIRWKLRHAEVEEGVLFRDEQMSGPFKRWNHTHHFVDLPDGRSKVIDTVEWEPPMDALFGSISASMVESELRRLFEFRRLRLRSDFRRHRAYPATDRPLRVAITGASGLLGQALRAFLETGGHEVVPLVRSRDRDGVFWDVTTGEIDAASLEGLDAFVHLAGESVAGGRWSEERKRAIRESRVKGTRMVVKALASLNQRPSVFVCSSGVNYYGSRGVDILTEADEPGSGFLAEVCQEWEEEARAATRAGIRTVVLRTGMVLSPKGGALGTMLLPFQVGIGGRLGNGRQFVSWIDHDDMIGLIYHVMRSPNIRGPVNATSPHPVTNATFTNTLGRVLRRPTIVPVPSLAIRSLFGAMGKELLLEGQRVIPEKAVRDGFEFHFPDLEASLDFQLGRVS